MKIRTISIVKLLLTFLIFTTTVNAQDIGSSYADELRSLSLPEVIPGLNNKQVILIGEPTHSEGTFLELNGMLVKRLIDEKGFDVVAFESGFYDLWKASQFKSDSARYALALRQAIYPIWSASKELQPLLDFLVERRDSVTVVGFDFQPTQMSSNYMVDDLESYLNSINYQSKVDFDHIRDIVDYLAYQSDLPNKYDHAKLEGTIDVLINALINRDDAESLFWTQCLNNLLSIASWYYKDGIAFKTEETFVAKDSNPRDLVMAENLLFWKNFYPKTKLIGWGAAPHFAYSTYHLESEELSQYFSMGYHLKRSLGKKVFNLGGIAGGGLYASHFQNPKKVDISDSTLLEARMHLDAPVLKFVNFDELPDTLVTQAFQYQPVRGVWRNVFDKLLYVDEIRPTTLDTMVFRKISDFSLSSITSVESRLSDIKERDVDNVTKSPVSSIPALSKRYLIDSRSVKGNVIEGVILDHKTKTPIPFATIRVKNIGTASGSDGRFSLNVPYKWRQDTIFISCIGYQSKYSLLGSFQGNIELKEKTETLDDVLILGKRYDAKGIFKNALLNIPNNYVQENFNAQYTSYSSGVVNSDTVYFLKYDVNSSLIDGYKSKGKNRPIVLYGHRKLRDAHWITPFKEDALHHAQSFIGDNYARSMSDFEDIGQQPIFSLKNIKKFNFLLDSIIHENGKIIYSISFRSKKTRFKLTNTFYDKEFYGKIYINEEDYAIIRTEMIWIRDAEKLSKFSDQYYKKPGDRFFIKVKRENNMETCIYRKSNDGKYYLVTNQVLKQSSGIDLRFDEEVNLVEAVKSDLSEKHLNAELIQENDYSIPLPEGYKYISTKKRK